MASFKAVVLKGNKRKDSTYLISIRLTHNRKSKYINTNLVVTKDDVTKGFKLKNYFFIDETDKIIKKYRDICNKNFLLLKNMDISQVYDLITKTEKSNAVAIDIIDFGMRKIETLIKDGRNGTARNIKLSLNNLIKFVGRDRIDINEITAKFVMDWINWIEGHRAKSLYPCYIRKLHNDAKREFNIEELGIIKIPLSPFSIVKLPKMQTQNDIDIPIEKIRELFYLGNKDNCKDITSRYNIARDLFILSFCLWGMNAKDLYECTDFSNGRITYNRAKTKNRRDDAALISIKVEPEIMPLVEKYRDKTGKRVFCFYQMYKNAEGFNYNLAKGIRKIRADIGIDYLVFYSARHSFATIATNEVGVDKYTVHQMLNHVDEQMRITDRYIRKDWKPLDEANRRLLDFVFER